VPPPDGPPEDRDFPDFPDAESDEKRTGRYPRIVGWSTGATDITVDLATNKREWYGDLVEIPETDMPSSFRVLEYSNTPPAVRSFEMGFVNVEVEPSGVGFKFNPAKPKKPRKAKAKKANVSTRKVSPSTEVML
jgi:hypothetical protein